MLSDRIWRYSWRGLVDYGTDLAFSIVLKCWLLRLDDCRSKINLSLDLNRLRRVDYLYQVVIESNCRFHTIDISFDLGLALLRVSLVFFIDVWEGVVASIGILLDWEKVMVVIVRFGLWFNFDWSRFTWWRWIDPASQNGFLLQDLFQSALSICGRRMCIRLLISFRDHRWSTLV